MQTEFQAYHLSEFPPPGSPRNLVSVALGQKALLKSLVQSYCKYKLADLISQLVFFCF